MQQQIFKVVVLSHRGHATRSAGCVGEQAEGKKAEKYAHLAPAYLFQPVAIETSGAIRSRSRAFLRELGRRVGAQTGETRSTSYLFQRPSVAIQCGNAAAVMGCAPPPHRLNPLLSFTLCVMICHVSMYKYIMIIFLILIWMSTHCNN